MYMHARQLRKVLLQQLIGPHDEIALFVALNHKIGHLQVAIDSRREQLVHRLHFKRVGDGHRIEHGLKVMIAVRPALYHVQAQIDLAVRKGDHLCFCELCDYYTILS